MFEVFALSNRTTERLGNLCEVNRGFPDAYSGHLLQPGKKLESYVDFNAPTSHLWMNLTG